MEIEAKFAVPDRALFRRLARLRTLAGYRLAAAGQVVVADRYFDTADGRVLAGGYACRLRDQGGVVLATLKGLGSADAAVHRRQELEVRLPTWDPDPAAWPPSAARDLALALTAGRPLLLLFALTQRRTRADVFDGDRCVAELSLDAVRVAVGPRPTYYYELEVELRPDGTEADLGRLAGELASSWGLQPEPASKFERGLALWRAYRATVAGRLTPEQRRQLISAAEGPDADAARRAAVILAWADGFTAPEIAARYGLSIPAVRYRIRAFRLQQQRSTEQGAGIGEEGLGIGEQGAAVSDQRSAISDERSAVSGQRSAISDEHPAISPPPPAPRPPLSSIIVAPPPPAAIQPDDPMSEAGRKVLALHFGKMLANEAGTRLGEDIEALHDMRVATRRMRAAVALFEPYYRGKVLTPLLRGLRRTGRTLGAVRDLDVLLEKAQAYAATLPPEQAGSLDPLLAHWTALRQAARETLLTYLDGSAYRHFCADFAAFVATPGAGAKAIPAGEPFPYQVRHVVPRLILTRYENVRAFEPILAAAPLTTYHQLRIECKGLRYALEFFRDVLGPETPALIKQVTELQDLLGALQDAYVAEGLLSEFLSTAGPLPGVESYLALQRARQQELLASFPAPWAALIAFDFRRALSLAVAVL